MCLVLFPNLFRTFNTRLLLRIELPFGDTGKSTANIFRNVSPNRGAPCLDS